MHGLLSKHVSLQQLTCKQLSTNASEAALMACRLELFRTAGKEPRRATFQHPNSSCKVRTVEEEQNTMHTSKCRSVLRRMLQFSPYVNNRVAGLGCLAYVRKIRNRA
jgi:hypothetical protein